MRACPRCGAAEIEFNERYRVNGETVPAWLCESPRCGYVGFVRERRGRRDKARQTSSQLRAKAVRAVMKARAKTERSKELIDRADRFSRGKQSG